MSKMSTELTRHALNGATMGTRWSALFFAPQGADPAPIQADLQAAVDAVDAQMSTWKPDSDLMRLNASPLDEWIKVPAALMKVVEIGLNIGRVSGGAFDIAMGDAVTAWGFGPETADGARIQNALSSDRAAAPQVIDVDLPAHRIRKTAPVALDLNGIAKGFGVDRLAEVLTDHGITDALVGIDGEMRALGLRPDGEPWTIAVENPNPERREALSILGLQDAAVATSGDYRHWVEVQGHRLSHTMDPAKGAPLAASPASVTVVARTCAEADAWATALMVLGPDRGADLARQMKLDALFLMRTPSGLQQIGIGALFEEGAPA
ncbi:FAD:protein FMN transferase [Nioella nitratireducens]|uniref:FAD:protein FMN transferase n=1 Tax=Nioella nitratireducens TaxID=1287720 RepID=UPI0008FD8758|nr:FAD:protein FMN transferase [Nioella nitratireducens]